MNSFKACLGENEKPSEKTSVRLKGKQNNLICDMSTYINGTEK